MIQLGLFFVFLWLFLHIVFVFMPFEVRLFSLTPLLAFGVLTVFLGFLQKDKKKKSKIGGMEELGIGILILEVIAAFIVLLFIGGYALSTARGFDFFAALFVSLALSFVSFHVYWLKHKGLDCFLSKHDGLLLFVSILSHSFWASLIAYVI